MICLTLYIQSETEPTVHLFNKSNILIGSSESTVDLYIENIQSIHLEIIEEDGSFFVVNQANDPFTSLNTFPFRKKLLNSGDRIAIKDIAILFENLSTPLYLEDFSSENPSNFSSSAFQDSGPLETFSLPFEAEVLPLQVEEWNKNSFDKYIGELEKQYISFEKEKTSSGTSTSTFKQSLKDDYLKHLEEDPQTTSTFNHSSDSNHLYQAWKLLLVFIFSIVTLMGIIGSIIYLNVSDKTDVQENKAAQGVADIAMALTHAQVNHLKPHNQNWADIDFLKTSLQAVLPRPHKSQVDSQGQFTSCPYSLRIYTSTDLSHFVLIAQPAPSVLNWLIPKSIIVVDSQYMELRILKDIRGLNRLLANSDALDGVNGREISSLIQQGKLFPLSSLGHSPNYSDFYPPANLLSLYPEADNFIYNAPRYYRIGQQFAQKAVHLSNSKASSQEISSFKQDVEVFAALPYFTLYVENGKENALITQRALQMLVPSKKISVGYISLNKEGFIEKSSLLQEEKSSLVYSPKEENEEIAYQALSEKSEEVDITKKPRVDFNHPIYIQLQAQMKARENELHLILTNLNELLHDEISFPYAHFENELQSLSNTYLQINRKYKKNIKNLLDNLYQQYENVSISEFLQFIQELNLDQFIQNENDSLVAINENPQQEIGNILTQIEKSKTLSDLEQFVRMATTALHFGKITNTTELLEHQNLLRNSLLKQLEKYLLTEDALSLTEEDKEILQYILQQERLIKPDEKDFFLSEFEELISAQKK